MFNYGMKVSIYSEKDAELEIKGWHLGGEDITYTRSNVRKETRDFTQVRYYYTLSFSHTFAHEEDTVYFAYSVPYTLTDLRNDIVRLDSDPERRSNFTTSALCKSLAGVDVPLITITGP
jgi:hypothetical protein